jgi:hypothetical protein
MRQVSVVVDVVDCADAMPDVATPSPAIAAAVRVR